MRDTTRDAGATICGCQVGLGHRMRATQIAPCALRRMEDSGGGGGDGIGAGAPGLPAARETVRFPHGLGNVPVIGNPDLVRWWRFSVSERVSSTNRESNPRLMPGLPVNRPRSRPLAPPIPATPSAGVTVWGFVAFGKGDRLLALTATASLAGLLRNRWPASSGVSEYVQL